MTTTINAVSGTGLTQTSDGSGIVKLQSNGVTTNALAWVNFNGTTSPGTIRSQYNVSSVTKNGTGDYTLNFTNALADANYLAVNGGNYNRFVSTNDASGTYTHTTTQMRCSMNDANGLADSAYMQIAIFGN